MKTETTAYKTERLKWATKPRIYLRPAFVRKSGDITDYPFARDLATHDDVDHSVRPKLACVRSIAGAAQQADPISGRSSIGFLEADLIDIANQAILRQVADPARPLQTAITSVDTPTVRNSNRVVTAACAESVVSVKVDDITGYPDAGHVTLDSEDVQYTGRDIATQTFTGLTRGARGTTPTAHVVATVVRNGEQLRRGTRISVHLGYAPLIETDYGPGPGFAKLEVQSLQSSGFNKIWSIRCSDLQRWTKRRVFEKATQLNPSGLGPAHPLTLMLQVLMSTGLGSNGPYDILVKDMGAGIPQAFIDVATFERLRGHPAIASVQMQFSEVTGQDAKEWVETQVLRPLMIIPDVNQSGQYTGRLLTSPTFRSQAGWRMSGRGA